MHGTALHIGKTALKSEPAEALETNTVIRGCSKNWEHSTEENQVPSLVPSVLEPQSWLVSRYCTHSRLEGAPSFTQHWNHLLHCLHSTNKPSVPGLWTSHLYWLPSWQTPFRETSFKQPPLVVSVATFVEPCGSGEGKSSQALGRRRASPAPVPQSTSILI